MCDSDSKHCIKGCCDLNDDELADGPPVVPLDVSVMPPVVPPVPFVVPPPPPQPD